MTWTPIWALPNIKLDEPVESEFFALAPNDDKRVRRLTRRHPEFRKFLQRFTDVHKNRIHPALILRREDAPKRLESLDAAVSFRDILVASIVPSASSRNLIYANLRNRASLSTFFWVYPWMIDRNFEYAIAQTPTTMSLHDASAINGQSSPELIPINVSRQDFDETLLQSLLERWTARYINTMPTWENIALFRSLNIANQACQIPGDADATIFDFGRIISLWVSAFETLVHPGENGRATLNEVYALLERVPWLDKRCGHRRFMTRAHKKQTRRNIACWIYNHIYDCRNDFLHGNPVNNSNLIIRRSGRPLINFAPPLYRLGLTSFLELSINKLPPPMTDTEAFATFCSESLIFEEPQRDAENAIRWALTSVEEQERWKQDRIAESRERTRQIKDSLNAPGS